MRRIASREVGTGRVRVIGKELGWADWHAVSIRPLDERREAYEPRGRAGRGPMAMLMNGAGTSARRDD